ncbi:MAG: VWA domain-containing protein [Planctomycetaceae bacterium]|nr:VWA domain-containing protein [Planctomycetaceae bacterium]MCB9953516.1 VWA domain-containing protein [Planctomycetaceae bacterium]
MDPVPAYYRRLPVYVVIDTSGSMSGEPIHAMEAGLRSLQADLMTDPQAIETVWISVITFDSTAQQIVPLVDIEEFDVPVLEAQGATAFGEAIELLMESIELEVRKTSETQKGDWRPMAFILTDGEPTDDWEEIAEEFKRKSPAFLIGCGAGPEADDAALKKVCDTVVHLKDTQPGTLGAFMQWVTLSVTNTSQAAGTVADRNTVIPEFNFEAAEATSSDEQSD